MAWGLVACAPEPAADAWILTPLSYDNRLDGEGGSPDRIDVTYPMDVTPDTAGGFWGHSAGSFVHIDADGTATRRFNLESDAPHGAIVALSPTTLVMARYAGAQVPGSVVLFDTETMMFDALHDDTRTLGAIAARGDDLYLAVYRSDEPAFTIETLSVSDPGIPRQVGPTFDGLGPVAIDVDDAGTVYIATESEHIVMAGDGTIVQREDIASSRPSVAVNGNGDAVWTGHGSASARVPSFVRGGSAEARDIIGAYFECDTRAGAAAPAVDVLTLTQDSSVVSSPFLCGPARATWIDDDQLVVSIGTEGGAVLVRVTPPEPAG